LGLMEGQKEKKRHWSTQGRFFLSAVLKAAGAEPRRALQRVPVR